MYNFKQARVVSVSKTSNSFGLKGVIIMDREGYAFEIGVNYLNLPSKGDVVNIATSVNNTNLLSIQELSYEIPSYKGKAPDDVIRQVWSKKFAPMNFLT